MPERVAIIVSLIALGSALLQLVFHFRKRRLHGSRGDWRIRIETPGEQKRDLIVAPHDVKSIETLLSEVSTTTKAGNDTSTIR